VLEVSQSLSNAIELAGPVLKITRRSVCILALYADKDAATAAVVDAHVARKRDHESP